MGNFCNSFSKKIHRGRTVIYPRIALRVSKVFSDICSLDDEKHSHTEQHTPNNVIMDKNPMPISNKLPKVNSMKEQVDLDMKRVSLNIKSSTKLDMISDAELDVDPATEWEKIDSDDYLHMNDGTII